MEIGDQRFCKIQHSFPHSQMGKCVGQMVARIFSYPSYIPNFSTLGWSLTPWIKLWEPYWSHKAAPSSSTEAATVRGFADNSAKLGYIARLHLDWYLQLYASCVKQSKRTVCAIKASPLRLKLSCRPIGWNSQTAILCNGGSIHFYACAQSSIGQRH